MIIAACAPSAGRKVIRYHAKAEDIISAIAVIGPTIEPSGAYNYYSINGIGDRYITLQASTTGGVSFFFGGSNISLTFTAIQSGETTSLAVSFKGDSSLANKNIDTIIQQLDARFTRVQALQ